MPKCRTEELAKQAHRKRAPGQGGGDKAQEQDEMSTFDIVTAGAALSPPACRNDKTDSARNSIQLEDLKPGDLLEIERFSGCFSHWGVYIGGGYIIHKSGEAGSCCSSQIDVLSACSVCGIDNSKTVVKKGRIKDVANGSKVMRNNMFDIEGLVPFPNERIVENARKYLDKNAGYNVLTKNCEHFAMLCRYGRPLSRQVQNGVRIVCDAANLLLTKRSHWAIDICGVAWIILTTLLRRTIQNREAQRVEVILNEEEDG